MTTNLALTNQFFHSYSYQHTQGEMLLSLNTFSCELGLSHSEYHLMGVLIGFWNKNHDKAFPSTRMLAKQCRMSNTTVSKNLKRLTDLGLIMIVKNNKNGRQNYYINLQKFLPSTSKNIATPTVTIHATACSSTHDIEQIKNKTNKEQTSLPKKSNSKNDDEFLKKTVKKNTKIPKNEPKQAKTTNITEYKQVLNKLDAWSYVGAKKTIKKTGLKKMQDLIKFVENNKPDNKGAYLRTLLNSSGDILSNNNKMPSETSEQLLIKRMLKHQYWKHIPSAQILKALPDIGTHLLIQYHHKEKMVTFFENGLTDKLKNFDVIQN